MADKMLELIPHQVAAARAVPNETVNADGVLKDLQVQVAQLTEEVKRLSRARDCQQSEKRFSRSHSRYRRRSVTPNRTRTSDICWYHSKFGDKANNCKGSCKFQDSEN